MKPEGNRDEVRKNRRQFPVNKKKNAEKQNNESEKTIPKENTESKRPSDGSDPLVKIPGKFPNFLT